MSENMQNPSPRLKNAWCVPPAMWPENKGGGSLTAAAARRSRSSPPLAHTACMAPGARRQKRGGGSAWLRMPRDTFDVRFARHASPREKRATRRFMPRGNRRRGAGEEQLQSTCGNRAEHKKNNVNSCRETSSSPHPENYESQVLLGPTAVSQYEHPHKNNSCVATDGRFLQVPSSARCHSPTVPPTELRLRFTDASLQGNPTVLFSLCSDRESNKTSEGFKEAWK